MTNQSTSPRQKCRECGCVVDPCKAAVLSRLVGDEEWIFKPRQLLGIYCGSDHLLDAYLRGYPLTLKNTRRGDQ